MKLERIPEKKFKALVKKAIGKHLPLDRYEIFVFGSRAKGDSRPRSDIDIGIRGEKAVPLATMSKIRKEVEELPVLYKVDVVDFHALGKDFSKAALKNSEIII